MKLFENLTSTIVAISAVALISGCCSKKNKGGTYSDASYTPKYSESPNRQSGSASSSEYSSASAPRTETKSDKEVVVPLYEESVQVSKREVDDGTVRLRKVVKTETINQPVTIRKESLVIDRQPGSATSAASAQAFQEQEIVVQLKHEEPVIQTTVVPSGNIVASTKVEERQTNVQHQVRREAIEIDKGNSGNVSVSESVGGTADTSSKTQGSVASSGTITQIETITTSSDPMSLNGRSVRLTDLTVDKVYDSQTISVSSAGGTPVIVHIAQPNTNLKARDKIDVNGKLKCGSAASWTEAGLSEQAWGANTGQAAYIQVESAMQK